MHNWEVEATLADSKKASVFSPSNIAVAKYWGKRDKALNLPTNGSISVTLSDVGSFTTVEFHPSFKTDRLILNGKEASDKLGKVSVVLELLRKISGERSFARVQSENNFPTGAGLASSASGLSAVVLAGARALALDVSISKISEIARKGSGSACRSLFNGFVEWERGELADGSDSVAHSFAPKTHWPLKVFVAIANSSEKNHASTGGMEHTKKTSPYFDAWIEAAQAQVPAIRKAILDKNFKQLAELSESNCIRMHSSAMSAIPPVFYWNAKTVEIMHTVWDLRAAGKDAFFTIDAGPNVVVMCEPHNAASVQARLKQVSGIQMLETEVGEGARVL